MGRKFEIVDKPAASQCPRNLNGRAMGDAKRFNDLAKCSHAQATSPCQSWIVATRCARSLIPLATSPQRPGNLYYVRCITVRVLRMYYVLRYYKHDLNSKNFSEIRTDSRLP